MVSSCFFLGIHSVIDSYFMTENDKASKMSYSYSVNVIRLDCL